MDKVEKAGFLTVSLFSVVMIFAALTGIAGYFSIDFISGAVSELLPDVQIYTSMMFLIQFVLIFLSATFLHWVSVSCYAEKKSLFLKVGAFLTSLCSLAINLLLIFKSGFKWIGFEIFHGQSIATHQLFSYLGILLFLTILIATLISGSILFKKSEARNYQKGDAK